MNTTKWTAVTVIAIVIIGISWYFLDHKAVLYPTPNLSQENNLASSTNSTSTNPAKTDATKSNNPTITNQSNPKSMHQVTIETSKGTIVFETYDQDAPKTVANFISLANKGFYNGLIFHRVIEGFMIQGGDPTGTGMGGPGYKFADELNSNTPSYKEGYVRGVVAMANSGPDTNGSQFFIMQADYPLPHNYSIFGKVVSGQDVVDAIAKTPSDAKDRPLTDVVMKKVTVATSTGN
jgi:cyclophilin family peptidyl-prolyl cis-trans isomerase